MRIGTSRADRLGFVVFAVLASLLAVLVVTNLDGDPTESAQSVQTFADVAPPAAVPETDPVALPEPTATAAPIDLPAAAAPDLDAEASAADEAAEEAEPDAEAEASNDAVEAPVAADSNDTSSATTTESTTTVSSANAQPAATAIPNPQPQATEVPNPQLPEDAAVPNPQLPEDAAVPNPQPGTTVAAAPVSIPADAPAGGTFTHTLTSAVARPTLHTTPGGPVFTPTFNGTALPAVNPTVFGNALVYRVIAGQPGDAWAKVYVPARPNGTTAWVQTSQFNWGSSNRMLQINISNNTVTVFEGSNVLLTTSAVVGKSSSRTPLANGWVEEIMAGPSSAYGPRLISLGIFSNDLNSFSGSIPKIALHGTNNPGLMGQYASNGCIRVENSIITQIAGMMPLGSKVVIVS